LFDTEQSMLLMIGTLPSAIRRFLLTAFTSFNNRKIIMKTHSVLRRSTLSLMSVACLGALTLQTASAQSVDDPYYYLGLSGGQSNGSYHESQMFGNVVRRNVNPTSFGREDTDSAFKLFFGYQFNRNWGMELGYFDLGQYQFNIATAPPGNFNGEVKVRGINFNLVGTMPLSDNFSVFAKAGGHTARTQGAFTGSGTVVVLNANPSTRKTNFNAGVGMQYSFNPSFQMRAEFERFRVDNPVGDTGAVNLATIGLIFPFGRTMTPKPRMAEAVYVAPAPVPAPVYVAPPVVVTPPPPPPFVAPPSRRVTFSAESLFAFDRSDISADGKMSLDKFVNDTRSTAYDTIIVEGHTDRIGSDSYNQALSERRAMAVKNYLASTNRLDAAKIRAAGKGESTPVTKSGDCVGSSATPKLIACLAPDRRVDVVVNATR